MNQMKQFESRPHWDDEQEQAYRLERLADGTDDIQYLKDLLTCNPKHPYRAGIEAAMTAWEQQQGGQTA